MQSLSVHDHVRPTGGDYPDGIYRVVGTSDDAVTLLRIGDADGRRVNTGEIVTVPDEELESFEPADDPDGNHPLGAAVATELKMVYWRVRVFAEQLIAHPAATTVVATLVAVGYVGDTFGPVSDAVASVLLFVGVVGLAYVGSGSLDR